MKMIQYRTALGDNKWTPWNDAINTSFIVGHKVEFRIKPEPREWWIVKTSAWAAAFTNEKEASNYVQGTVGAGEIIRAQEIL